MPPDTMVKFCPMLVVPKTNPIVFVILTSFAPLLLKLTPPVKRLFCVNVIGLAPAVKLVSPPTVITPVCVIDPDALTVKLLPIFVVARIKSVLFVMLASFAPLLFKPTAPVNMLFCANVIGLAPAVKLAVPATVNAPVWVIAPLAMTVKLFPRDVADRLKALLLVILTSFAPLLASVTAPVNRLFCVSVIAFAPALKLDKPGTVKSPVCEIAPVAVTVKLFPTLDAPKIKPMLLVILTSLIPLLFSVTGPVKALFCVNVIGLAPELKLDAPATVKTPDCVIGPFATTVKLLPAFKVVKAIPVAVVILMSLAPVLFKVTVPTKVLFWVSVIGFAPALNIELPWTVIAPVCVMAPLAVTVKSLPNVDAPKTKALLFVILTLFAPLLVKDTAPENKLFCVRVIALAPALKVEVPGTVSIPVWVIGPDVDTVKLFPIEDAARTKPMLLVMLTLLATPLLLNVTAPVNALFCISVITLDPALKLAVPGTVNTPD